MSLHFSLTQEIDKQTNENNQCGSIFWRIFGRLNNTAVLKVTSWDNTFEKHLLFLVKVSLSLRTSSFVVLSLASLTALLLRVTTILGSHSYLKLGQYVSNRFFYLSIYSTSCHLETPANAL